MDDAAAAWVALVTGARSVRPVRSLSAGVTSELTVLDVDGRRLVLRRWDRADPTEQTPAGVTAEVRALTAGRAVLGPLVPEPVAADPTGAEAGRPAVLMTLVPGRPVVAALDVAALAAPAAALHAATPDSGLPPAQHWFEPGRAVPSWTREPAAWSLLLATLRHPEPRRPAVFLHRDYHPGNVLWSDGAISGIVDWAAASVGPAGIDVAHTRTNLALVDGVDAAARYLAAYQALVPGYGHDSWWDAADVAGFDDAFAGVLAFNAFGAGLDVATVRARADAYVVALTERT